MKVYLDERAMEGEFGSVASAIRSAAESADQAGRVVIEIAADGGPIDPALLDSPPEDHTAGLNELRFVSAPLSEFVQTTLQDAIPVLDEIRNDSAKAAELIQGGEVESALEPLERARASWRLVLDVVEKSSMLLGVERAAPVGGEGCGSIADAEAQLAKSLIEVKRAVTEQDWSALSDELAYEVPGQVEAWKGIVGGLVAAADSPG